ncbi:MAG: oxidoreductase, partial [Neisseriaceae bacterium]|nr:oxidoreductase [Neisseriaceae bacterium]
MNTSVIHVALIGYGYAGKTFHAPLILACKALELSVIVSRQGKKILAEQQNMPSSVRILSDVQALWQDDSIDLVVIATPNDTHYPLAQAALMAGKHVVIDKPFTLTLTEAQALNQQAISANLTLSVFHNRRWDGDFLTLQTLVRQQTLGDIVSIRSYFDRFRPQVRPRWREQAQTGSGLWYDLGPHLLDQAIELLGMPRAIFADLAILRTDGVAVDYFEVILYYKTARVVLHASALAAAPAPRFTVHGKQGSWVKWGLDLQENQLKNGLWGMNMAKDQAAESS